jgi:endoglucanase
MTAKQIHLISVLMLISSVILAQSSTISKGVGFSQAFESGTSVYDIRFNYYSKQDFLNIKKLGIDEVRLPIFLSNMVQQNGKLSPLFLYLLDQYVDIAESENVNIILTNMSGYDYSDTASIRSQFLNVWTQLAEHYKDRSNLIYYELANEPSNISDESWGLIQGEVIDAIRDIDTVHTIIVTPAMWGSLYNLQNLPEYADTNLIYTFHFYDPFLFTHQGAASQGFEELIGMPFPYDINRMPSMPASFIGTWNEGRYYDYSINATVEKIREQIGVAAAFKNQRSVRVWCGEFGADDQYSDINDRALWYETLRTALEENGIAWSMHGYTRYWGLFEFGTDKLFDYDLNIPIVEAMGLNTQPQSEFEVKPDSTAFVIYDDYVSCDLDLWISVDDTLSHVYAQNDPKNGKFCIQMKDFPIWSMFRFNFTPERDFSRLVEEGYCLSFWIKGNTPGARFNVRFFDTDTGDPDDHQWRMVYDIDENLAPWDNEWHFVQIPLANFIEQGADDEGTWYEPEGKFDWSAIDEFHIQSEFESLEGKQFWFDDIQIAPATASDSANITFRVNMQNEAISPNGVNLNGSFSEWSEAVTMQEDAGFYYTTLKLPVGENIEYKFVNGGTTDWDMYEIISGECSYGNDANRQITVPLLDTILPIVCFGSCENSSVETQLNTEIGVFPNPTTSSITIKNLPKNEKFEINIYTINCQPIKTLNIDNLSYFQIDLSFLNAGIYFVNIIGSDINLTTKIIKTDL